MSYLGIELHFQFGACVAGIYSAASLPVFLPCGRAQDRASSSLLGEGQLPPYQGWLGMMVLRHLSLVQSQLYHFYTNPQ